MDRSYYARVSGRDFLKGSLKDLLAEKLEPAELEHLIRSYDVIGDIAVIRVPENLTNHRRLIADTIMEVNKSIHTVLHQISPVSGDFRLRKLEWIAGQKKTETLYKEHGCSFKVDLNQCFFSPRLSFERMRVAEKVQPKEVLVNMFAGVGCYSIIIAKHSQAKEVFSIDINPVAVKYIEENVRLNRVENRVIPVLGDARIIIEERLRDIADRVLMPLPEKAYEYLDWAVSALKPTGGYIHYYDVIYAKEGEDAREKSRSKLVKKFEESHDVYSILFDRIVRTIGPRWYQIVFDIKVQKC